MIDITHFQTFLKIPKRVKSSNLGTKSLKVRVLAKYLLSTASSNMRQNAYYSNLK